MPRKPSAGAPASTAADFVTRGRIVVADLDVGQALLRRALLDGSSTEAAREIISAAAIETKRIGQEALARLADEEAARQAQIESAADVLLDESIRLLQAQLDELLPPFPSLDLRS